MRYNVKIRKADHTDEERVIEAPSRFDLYQTVSKEGGTLISVEEGGAPSLARFNISFGTGVKRREVIMFAKNLSAMLVAGLALARALSVLERQSKNKHFKAVMTSLAGSITKGATFHDALGVHPRVFSRLFVSMVLAGEESGGLANALSIVATQMDRTEELTRKIKGAMIYPAIVLTAMVVVAVLMLIYVVPTLAATFTSLKVKIPIATQVIMSISAFMASHVILVLVLLVLFAVGGTLFVRSRPGTALVLRIALHIPVVGELVRETYAARACRTLSSLLASGVQMIDAISIASEVVGAPIFANVLVEADALVKKGQPLSSAFILHPNLYPLMMSDMIAVGEETGKLSDMMGQVADFYEGDVAQKTKDLSTIVEPVLMLVVGATVGVFAVSMIAPIYSLSGAF